MSYYVDSEGHPIATEILVVDHGTSVDLVWDRIALWRDGYGHLFLTRGQALRTALGLTLAVLRR